MEILTALRHEKKSGPCVVAIGNFDGVHRGHQALLARAREIAAAQGLGFSILTFEPHPRVLFQPDEPPARITPRDIKFWRLGLSGAARVYALPFDWDFASQSAEGFIEKILKNGIGAAHVVVGGDFRFGQLRKGAPADIARAGIDVTVMDSVNDENGVAFSSSRVRAALRAGDMAGASALLGWNWEIRGAVMRGDRRGHELGYPTANMALGDTIHPAYGVYAALVAVVDDVAEKWRPAAINIGIRPMFETKTAQVESHILDFSGDLYEKTLRVRPVKFLRGEAKFPSLDALKNQMAADCAAARQILKDF